MRARTKGRCLASLKDMLPPADKVKQESHQVTKERKKWSRKASDVAFVHQSHSLAVDSPTFARVRAEPQVEGSCTATVLVAENHVPKSALLS